MIKLYGHPVSTCTRKVLMTLAETNTPFEFISVDLMKGAQKQPPHTSRQPFGHVPALEDDGFAMYESRAMCRYVDRKAGGRLLPSDPKGLAQTEQWISVETSEFTPNGMKFIFQDIFKRPQEPGVIDAARAGLEAASTVVDKQLSQSPFIAGSAFTLADVCFMPYVDYVLNTSGKEVVAKHPRLMAWWNKVSERPAWRKATGKA